MENLKKIGWFFVHWISVTAGLFGAIYVTKFLANNLGSPLENDPLIQYIGRVAFLVGFLVAYLLSSPRPNFRE